VFVDGSYSSAVAEELPPAINAFPVFSSIEVDSKRGDTVFGPVVICPAPGPTIMGTIADCVGSAADVATTWYVPATDGAVYTPPLVIEPPAEPSFTLQVTPVLLVPETVAVN
jgi:hypothetical protein